VIVCASKFSITANVTGMRFLLGKPARINFRIGTI
jgi:hypothetical protein